MATKLARTGTSSTNATKFTWSAWVKKCSSGTTQNFLENYLNADNKGQLRFLDNEKLYYYDRDGANTQAELTTTAVYRDCNAWYHICLIGDTTDGTQGDRIQLYVNGVRQTMTGTYPDANDSLGMKVHTGTNQHAIGTSGDSTSNPFSGIISHVHYVDGIDYPATTFGETDSTTGEWKIKTSPSISTSDYGNNGYFILKDTNSGTDQSGNSHNLTVTSGTLTKTEDSPSNVFNTFNENFQEGGGVLSNGNTTYYNASTSNWYTAASNLAASVGKYYCELKITDATDNMVGVGDMQYLVARGQNSLTHIGALNPGGVGLYNDNGEKYLQGSNTTYAASYGDGDILSIALDMDNDKVYFAKNGDWSTGSGAWGSSTFDAAVGAITLPTTNATYGFASSQRNGAKAEWNFGNGYFGTTAVSSAGTNASGIGIFEYDVPTGYTALSTKGLNL